MRQIAAIVLLLGIAQVLPQDIDPASMCSTRWNTNGKASIDLDYTTDFNILTSVTAYFCERRPVKIQVWRPIGALDFELLWEYPMLPPNVTPGIQKLELPVDFHFPVEQIYRVGFAPVEYGNFPIGMNFFPFNLGSVVVSNENSLPTPLVRGNNYSFLELLFPYKFGGALCNNTDECELPDISTSTRPLLNETQPPVFNGTAGLSGPPGPMGVMGPMGQAGLPGIVGIDGLPGVDGDQGTAGLPGPAGSKGPKGDTGDSGPLGAVGVDGEVGLAGLPGPAGPLIGGLPTPIPVSGPGCECKGFSDPNLVLGMLIWALLLTVFIVIMLVLATHRPQIAS